MRRGHRPVLAGRTRPAIEALASELGLDRRVFDLADRAAVEAGLEGMTAVLHCAGPFARTAGPMNAGCLRARAHYLDVTGEVEVFETLAALHRDAQDAGVMLLPGVGFDVVPSDCLAAHLKRRLPSATRLALALRTGGGLSRGTAITVVENLHRGGLVRRNGVLRRVPAGWKTRHVDFGRGPRAVVSIPWGDVSTAFHSTGIPDVEVYLAAPLPLRIGLKLVGPFGPLLASRPVQRFLRRRIEDRGPGPTREERAHGRSHLWGEAADDHGARVVSRLEGPEGYTLTALTAVAAMEKVLAGSAPVGFQTPSRAYGADFVLQIDGVRREDL